VGQLPVDSAPAEGLTLRRIVMGQQVRRMSVAPTRVFDAHRDLTVVQHASVSTPRSIGNCAINFGSKSFALLAVSIFVPTLYAQSGADHGSQGSY
jgi:hypothetical protein